ncbi:MAG: DNA cytosine methyltransferase [Roseburia sp.]|nr:DNA cytosine methyltransferase [Roseburia sp.]
MEKTVVVLNDELGGMAYAYQSAGFKVLCDVVPNEESIWIAEKNLQDKWNIQICKLSEEAYMELPEASVLVGRLPLLRGSITKYMDYVKKTYFEYIKKYLPEVFCIEALEGYSVGRKLEAMEELGELCDNHGYKIYIQTLRTQDITGLPVRGKRLYIVGCKKKDRI